jgi:uncharacterized protein (DUF58 family)
MIARLRDCLAEGRGAGMRYSLGLPKQAPMGISGNALSQRAGSSLEFKDHRDYQPGDDLRHIDWNAYARSDQLTVKMYREEVLPHVEVVLDVSKSMDLEGSEKGRAAVALAAFFATAAANAGFSHMMWLLAGEYRPVINGQGTPETWGEFDLSYQQTDQAVPGQVPASWRPRGTRILISDLFWLGEPLSTLRPLAERSASTIVVQLLARADADPPQTGNLRLVDAETGLTRDLHVDDVLLRRYREGLARHQQNWHRGCRQVGAVFTTVIAETVLEDWKLEDLVQAEVLRVK